MTVDSATFRSVLAQWPSGVSVVTTLATDPTHGARPHGMTASSLTSVSLDPPLVSVCIANHLPTRELIGRSGVFAVSILGKDQSEIGKRFAGLHAAPERFNGGSWQVAATGCPVLSDATGWIDCRLEHVYPGGDHTIFVGHVVAADTPRLGAPLLFHSRAWGQLADPLPDGIVIRAPSGGYVIANAFAADREQQVLADIASARDGLTNIASARDGLTDIASDGHNEICLVEAGNASPVQVRRVLQEAVVIAQGRQLRVRLRAHHGLGLVNALVAMKSGVRLFDATSDGADGSLRASDLAYLAAQLGIACTSPFVRTAP